MMNKLYKVEGHSNLKKDPRTGTIQNTNHEEIRLAKLRKSRKKEKELEENQLKQKVEELNDNVKRIESMLQQLLEK